MGQPDDCEALSAGDTRSAKMPRMEEPGICLSKFHFKEVLGSDPSRKSIFILVQHVEKEQERAILILDKLSFNEDGTVIDAWLPLTKLELKASNDIYYNYIAYLDEKYSGVKATIIYPCTDKHIIKYRRKEPFIVYETPEDFQNIVVPFINEQAMNLQWVYNVIEGKSEVDRVIYRDEDEKNGFLIAMDLKWSGIEVDSLYLQAIIKRRDLPCIRALTAEHLPLLKHIRDVVYELVPEKYGLKKSQIKMYFHYQPSFYHLHVHIINLKYDAPASGMTSVPLEEVISNLENFPEYYQKATIMFIKGTTDPLLERFIAAGRVQV